MNNDPYTTPTPPTQLVQPPIQQQYPVATQTPDPGKTLSIIGIVLSFLALQLFGLIFSIIGHSKSKKAGKSGTAGIVGIILNVVGLVLFVPILLLMVFVALPALQQGAQDTAASQNLTYNNSVATNSLSSQSYGDLINATSGYFAVVTNSNQQTDPAASQPISITGASGTLHVTLTTYDTTGTPTKDARFGELMPEGTTLMCLTDYQNRVSMLISFDPAGGDGNTATVTLYDQTNCFASTADKAAHPGNGDINITLNDVVVNNASQVPASYRSIYTTVAGQLKSSSMLTNIRAHFIGSFSSNL